MAARWLTVVLLLLIFLHSHGWAQGIKATGNAQASHGTGAPVGSCQFWKVYVDDSTGDFYDCFAGSWLKVTGGVGGTGSGTVTSFSAGSLSPLFTTSVATPTSTPALSFTLSTAAAHSFFGNNTGVVAAPAFESITAADLPGSITSSTSGNAATATALAANPTDCAANNYATAIDASGNLACGQVAYSQVTGTPVLPANTTATAHQFFDAYNSGTGAFTKAQPACGDLSDSSGGCSMSTTAGGDLSGTLPSPTVAKVNGTSIPTNAAADQVPLTTAAQVGSWASVPSCSNATTSKLLYNTTTHAFSCGTDQTSAGGASTEVQVDAVDTAAQTPISFNDGSVVTFSNPSVGNIQADVATGSINRARLASDAIGWQFLGCATIGGSTGCTTVATGPTVSVTLSASKKHLLARLLIVGYANTGVARVEFGNTTTVDTGSNYAFGGLNIASGTSTAPTVSGVGSGSSAQEGVPVSGSTTTAGRFVQVQISNPGARIKYFTIETSGVGTSAAVTPNLAYLAGTWNNTTNGIGIIQFKACTAINSTCSTVNLNTGTSLTVWGRDDE